MEQSLTPQKLISLLGGFPDKPPLAVRVLEVWEHGTHQRQLIEYTTEGDERVQAFLLVPSQTAEKLPGIVAIHQDGAHRPYEFGKSEPAGVAGDPELAYGLELCLRGYVVICPDRFPFESRSLARSRFKEQFDEFRIFTEHGLELTEDLYAGCVANWLLLEEGRALPGKHLFELQRAVDCLCEQHEVDGGRIGAIGHSAGGFLAALLMYVDPRVQVGCASCGTYLYRGALNKDRLRPINGFGGFAVPGLKRWGDMDDVRAGLAPRPFLETTDPGSDQEMAELTGKARARYAALGVPERYQYVTYDALHIFRKDMRELSYAWFDRWLKE
jgi:dienelactone hydrolase